MAVEEEIIRKVTVIDDMDGTKGTPEEGFVAGVTLSFRNGLLVGDLSKENYAALEAAVRPYLSKFRLPIPKWDKWSEGTTEEVKAMHYRIKRWAHTPDLETGRLPVTREQLPTTGTAGPAGESLVASYLVKHPEEAKIVRALIPVPDQKVAK